jgi:hypothetical protein
LGLWFFVSFRNFFSDNTRVQQVRDGPFNFQEGGGGLCFFSKKNILIPNVVEKNILILVEEKRFNIFCKLLADFAKRAGSSAYIIKNNLT